MTPLSLVILPSSDIEASIRFYTHAFGWKLDFADGSRWAQLDAGGTKIALAGPGGGYEHNDIGLGVKVDSLATVREAATAAGTYDASSEVRGNHEYSLDVFDPNSHRIVNFTRLS